MLAKEVLRLCVSALFVQVLFNLVRVIVQFGGVPEVVKEEQFGTSFCLKEFYMAVYTFLWLREMKGEPRAGFAPSLPILYAL